MPIGAPGRPHRDHELVRRGRTRFGKLEQAHLAAERFDPSGLHPSHCHRCESYGAIYPTAESAPRGRRLSTPHGGEAGATLGQQDPPR